MKRLKRIFCLFLVCICFLGSLWFPEKVKAADYDLSSVKEDFDSKYNRVFYGSLTFEDMEYIVFEVNDLVLCFVGDSIIYSTSTRNDSSVKLAVKGFTAGDAGTIGARGYLWKNGAFVSYVDAGSPTTFYIGDSSHYSDYKLSDTATCLEYLNTNGIRVLACSQDVYDSDGNLYQAACDFGWEKQYDPNLGTIKDIEFKKLFLVDSTGNTVDYDSVKYKFEFDNLSTGGVDLTENCYILHSIVVEVHFNDSCKVDEMYSEVVAAVWNASKLSFEYTNSQLEVFISGSGFTGLGSVSSNFFHVNIVHYFQIYKDNDDGTQSYGDRLRFSECESKYTVENPDGEDTGSSGVVDSGSGSGTTYEDAELNIGNVTIEDGYKSDNLVTDVESLLGFIGAFPAVIAALLSFLPAQYQLLIYVSIGLAIALVVWKVLRG